MKATGIVRRIDDLGRVVIPKEIRRTLAIREGDPLEIFLDGQGGVVFRKYFQPTENKRLSLRNGLKITRSPCVLNLALRIKSLLAKLLATIAV